MLLIVQGSARLSRGNRWRLDHLLGPEIMVDGRTNRGKRTGGCPPQFALGGQLPDEGNGAGIGNGVFHKERKRSKKKEKFGRGGLWKLPQPWKSTKDAFGGIFLMISTAVWKSLRGGPLRLSHSYAQARRRLTINPFSTAAIYLKFDGLLSNVWGVPQGFN